MQQYLTLSQSHLSDTSIVAGAAAERAAKIKHDKYQELTRSFEFCAVAIETLGPINKEGIVLIWKDWFNGKPLISKCQYWTDQELRCLVSSIETVRREVCIEHLPSRHNLC